jgi:hypothetical protein
MFSVAQPRQRVDLMKIYPSFPEGLPRILTHSKKIRLRIAQLNDKCALTEAA